MGDIWVFGYGSLMWRPDFDYAEKRHATLYGMHRSLCVYSWVHRGTKENPGLVFGLDKGGECQGVAYRICERDVETVVAYLRERELVTNVYLETWLDVQFGNGEIQNTLTYVVDANHDQYAGKLSVDAMVEIVRQSVGKSGNNIEYVTSTVEMLKAQGVQDSELESLYDALGAAG